MNQPRESLGPSGELRKVRRTIGRNYPTGEYGMLAARYAPRQEEQTPTTQVTLLRQGLVSSSAFRTPKQEHPLAGLLKGIKKLTERPIPTPTPERTRMIERSDVAVRKRLWLETHIRALLQAQLYEGQPTGQQFHAAEKALEAFSAPYTFTERFRKVDVPMEVLERLDHARAILGPQVFGPDNLITEELLREQQTGTPVLKRLVVEDFPFSDGTLFAAKKHGQTLIPFTSFVQGEATLSWELSSPSRIGRFIQKLG